MPQRHARLWTALSVLISASLACGLFGTPPTATPAFTPTPAASPTPLPPIAPNVVDRLPARGDEHKVNDPVTVYFDSPMDRASVERAFSVNPPVAGTFTWSDNDATLVFKPNDPLQRASKYSVSIDTRAVSKSGLPMAKQVVFDVETVGFLEVTKVLPEPETSGASPESIITVMFNRPVVPLTDLANQATLPNPLALTPLVDGKGEWLNTSIYVFRPSQPLAGGQTYTGQVAAGLDDVTGGELPQDFSWTFTVAPPIVLSTLPAFGQANLALTEPISVTFNQAMEHRSAEAAFSLSPPVPGSFHWSENSQELGFVPSELFSLGTTYHVTIGADAQAAGGSASLGQDFTFDFTTVQPAGIIRTEPDNGASNVEVGTGFRLFFASPMRVDTLDPNIEIVPKPTQVFTYFNESDFTYYVGWNLQPSTQYQVTLKPGMTDPYGNPALTEPLVVNFTTAPFQPQGYFNTAGQVGTYSAYVPTQLYLSTVNVGQADLGLYRLSRDEFFGFTGPNSYDFQQNFRPQAGALVRSWQVPIQNELNARILTPVSLAEDNGTLPAGLYYLQLNFPGTSIPSQYHLLAITKSNLTLKSTRAEALAWATDLQSGQPTPNLPLTFYDQNFAQIGQGTTDAQGVLRTPLRARGSAWENLYAMSPEGEAFAVSMSGWSSGLDPWEFNVNERFDPSEHTAYLYTDRPLYRPGQVVYFKGALRKENDARFSLPAFQRAPVAITNDRGETVFADQLPLTPFGTFSGEFKLGDEVSLGSYNITVKDPTRPAEEFAILGGVGFGVAQYRKPEFQVSVTTPKPEVVQGETIPATVDATFFFGGPVSNANVQWSVLAADYVFPYRGQGYYDFIDFDWSSGEGGPLFGTFGRLIMQKEGQTDAQGKATLNVPADLSDKGLSQLYTIEATITDPAGNQQVSGRMEVIVHQGQFYVGVRPEEYVGTANQPVNINLVTVSWGSTPFPNQKLKLEFFDHQWNCALEKNPETGGDAWTCHVQDTLVGNTEVTTNDKGEATASFTPTQGGTYKVLASGTDSGGHTVKASTIVWVSDDQFVTWRQNNNDRITLVTDRKSYRPGDTAEILIPSPFQGSAMALVTLERGGILKHEVLPLANNSTVYKLPITADYAPDVFFSVVIVKGVDANNPAPAFKMGLVQLSVSPEQQQLKLTLTPDKTKVGPRDTVTYALKATDYTGQPVQAEFSLAVVDLAVLQLTGPNSGPIMDAFYGERGLGVRTASGLTLSVDRLNLEAERAKGGGGGAEQGFNDVRSNFLDTAFWRATVTTNANGEASVAVPLPDNLTTWRLDARGLTADTLVGQGTVDIVATKDLLIRPVTPRFFVVGDQAELAAVVNNNTPQDIQASVTLAGTGVSLRSPATQSVTVKAGDRAEVNWNVTAEDAAAADLTFTVEGGGFKDSSKPTLGLPPAQTLPILKYSAPETTATAGQLEDTKPLLEAVSLPRRFDVTQGALNVKVAHSLAAATVPALEALENPDFDSTDSLVSSFLPNVLTYRAFKQLNLADPSMEAKLSALVNEALQRLYARQKVDGGWAWWIEGDSDPFLTAYTLFGLSQARQAGFRVSDNAVNNAVGYLSGQITNPAEVPSNENWRLNRQAFLLYVLADAGSPLTSATVQLYDVRDRLDAYARAYLALALRLANPGDDSRIRTILSDLNNAAILSATGAHWEEKERDWWNMNTNTRSTAIVLMALARLDPTNQLIPNVVRWLMSARTADMWETTQETAWSLIALTDWMSVSGELKANYNYQVSVNFEPKLSGTADAGNVRDSQSFSVPVANLLKDQANRLIFQRGPGDGRLYYTANLNLYLPVGDVRAISHGIVVGRQYTLVSKDCGGKDQPVCPPITEAKAGDNIRVKVTLIAPNDLYYVALEDPIPAGAEPVDTSLLTTSVVGQPPEIDPIDPFYYGWGWWWFSKTEIRDSKVMLFANYLPRGTYEYTYSLRASLPGAYQVMPTAARETYFPEVFGRGDGLVFTIRP